MNTTEQDRRRWDVMHRWINQRQQGKPAGEGEPDLYEWPSMLEELRRLPYWLRAARTGTLRTVHQQCSRQSEEPIPENTVICALGVNVLECPILQDFYAVAQQERERATAFDARMAEKWPDRPRRSSAVPIEADDDTAAEICCWHIFTEQQKRRVDTFEGYVQDESDRLFWRNTYANMAAGEDDDEPPEPDLCPACGGPSVAGLVHPRCAAEATQNPPREPRPGFEEWKADNGW